MEMQQIVKINVNDYVRVRLTEQGETLLKEKNKIAYDYHFNKNNSVLEVELCDLMNTFGEYLYNGSMFHPFVNNQIIVIEGI
jgi:hypothetical protein